MSGLLLEEKFDWESVLNTNPTEELAVPTIGDYSGCGFAAYLQVDIKGKILQESKVKHISPVDASELAELFYHSVGKNAIALNEDIYQGWLNQQEDSYLHNYLYPISLRSTLNCPGLKRQNYAAAGIGSICAGYSLKGIPALEDTTHDFSEPTNVSSGKIINSRVCWSYSASACSQGLKLKHVFKLFLKEGNKNIESECFYLVIFTTYDCTTLGNLALNFASQISKEQTGPCSAENKVQALLRCEKLQVKSVSCTEDKFCLDVAVELGGLETHRAQVFWRSVTGSYGYLDPISFQKKEDGTEVLRVRFPSLEQEKHVFIGVTVKHFDDLYSNMVSYTYSATQATPQKHITPVRARTSSLDAQTAPVQCLLPIFHVKSTKTVPNMPPQAERTPVNPLTPLQLFSFRGSTVACSYMIRNQITKSQVEDTFSVICCAIFSGNMRTFIVCQAYHMWCIQLITKETLFELLHLVMDHEHFRHPLSTGKMLSLLPRETEKQVDNFSRFFAESNLHKIQHAFNQMNFVVSSPNSPNSSETPPDEGPRNSEFTPTSPITSPSEIICSTPQISLISQTPSQVPVPPTLTQAPNLSHTQPEPQKMVSYQEIHNLLFNEPRYPYTSKISLPTDPSLTPQYPHPSPFPSPLVADQLNSFFTPQVYPTFSPYQPPRSYVPAQLMPAPQPPTPALPLYTPPLTLATPVQPYRSEESEPEAKRARTGIYLQSKRLWKTQRTDYPQLPTLLYSPPPPQTYPTQQNLHLAAQPTQSTHNYVIPQQSFTLPQTIIQDPPQLKPHTVPPQPHFPVQIVQAELLAHTLAVAKQQAERQEQLATPAQQQPAHPAPERETQHEAQQHTVAPRKITPSRSAPRLLCRPEYSAPVELDQSHEVLESAARTAPWQLRRLRRSNSSSAISCAEAAQSPECAKANQAPLKWKLKKSANPAPAKSGTEQPNKEIPEAKKHRFYKPRREQDDDYEMDDDEEEGEEAAEDDDEEYREVPLRRRRSPNKRKNLTDSLHVSSRYFANSSCACKICKFGLPSNFLKPLSWSDISLLTLTCLTNTSRFGTKCFNLQNEIFPFVERHYEELVPANIHGNSWKKKMQVALTNSDQLFVCVKEDKASPLSELWTLRTAQDLWVDEESISSSHGDSDDDSDEEVASEFEEEMSNHLLSMREQLRGAQNQRDLLNAELFRVRTDVQKCTKSLYNVVSSCAAAASPQQDVGAKIFDEIFGELFDEIREVLGDYADRVLPL
eukprot:Phypoly_transcript_00824.p1 GENE.Phypoly_transcript_00824~~Phypoly_transcript_00824.p1  ORF type:complete len:1240 (+),score=220.86 Phypoly_transcript_00824:158-3877(+)